MNSELRAQLQTLANIYSSLEDGKATITNFEYHQDTMDVTTMGSSYSTVVKSGPLKVTLEVEIHI